jgi:hypothetical protein
MRPRRAGGRGRSKPNSSREKEAAQAFACGCSPLPGQQMTLRSWRPLVRGSLRGFAAVTLPIGIEVDEISGSRTWASLPARPMIDGEGRVLRDDRGKIRYASPICWQTHGLAAEFGRRVIELVRRTLGALIEQAGLLELRRPSGLHRGRSCGGRRLDCFRGAEGSSGGPIAVRT